MFQEPLIKVRVVDFVFDRDGSPLMDETDPTGTRQKKNGGGYVYKGEQHPPGSVLEMPESIAKQELRVCGWQIDAVGHAGRHALLEPYSLYLERLAAQKEQDVAREADRHAFKRMSEDLEAANKRAAQMQKMIQERDAERLQATLSPETTNQIEIAQKEKADAERRILQMSEEMRAKQIELAEKEAEAERRLAQMSEEMQSLKNEMLKLRGKGK